MLYDIASVGVPRADLFHVSDSREKSSLPSMCEQLPRYRAVSLTDLEETDGWMVGHPAQCVRARAPAGAPAGAPDFSSILSGSRSDNECDFTNTDAARSLLAHY